MPNSVLYLVCFILAGVGAWVVSKFAYKCSLIDIPGDRSSHEIPIPKGGGIGILAAFALASMVLKIPSGFWLSATILALISLHGDRSELSPKFRVTVQFIATISFLLTSRSLILAPYHSLLPFLLWLLFLTIFIVGTANFYNFMDGINGIAAITGIVGFGLLALYSFLSDRDSLFVVLSICISLSCLGFLPFNMPKAKVFIGDVGSILLGFVFAAMVVWLSRDVLDFMVLSAFLFPFYVDELTTLVVRIKDRDRLTRAHRKHLYQLLANEMGITHWKISVGYGLLQLIVGVSVLVVKPVGIVVVMLLLAGWFGVFILLTFRFSKRIRALAASE